MYWYYSFAPHMNTNRAIPTESHYHFESCLDVYDMNMYSRFIWQCLEWLMTFYQIAQDFECQGNELIKYLLPIQWQLRNKYTWLIIIITVILFEGIFWLLTHCGLMTPYGDGNKPLPEPMLTYHQSGRVAFIWGQFHKKYHSHQPLKLAWKLSMENFDQFSQRPMSQRVVNSAKSRMII